MTPGDLVDAFIRGLLSVQLWQVFLLILLSILVAFSRWWFNHYNLRRAIAYSKTAFLFILGSLFINILTSYREPWNALAWNLIAMNFLVIIFIIIGYYMALLPKASSHNFKLWLIAFLQEWITSLEISAQQSESPLSIEKQEKQTIDLLKEVVKENAEQIKVLML